MRKITTLFLLCGFFLKSQAQTTASDLVITITAQVYNSGTLLTWTPLSHVATYKVLRKSRSEKNFTTIATNLPATQNSFLDVTTTKGSAYEYCVQSANNTGISGYLYAGKELPAVHQQGEVLLIVDNTYKLAAQSELNEYRRDLIKEGWKVKTEYVNRTQSVASVKALINTAYSLNPSGLKGVILLGHIPVPYSGNIAPDAHPDHQGAWPSDMYYGDVSATANWNDVSIQTISATDVRNHNTIGDGKYDISVIGGTNSVRLFVGRIDVFNMPSISTDDVALFKQYLVKNHVYRSAQKVVQYRGMVQDNFGFFSGEAFAQNGYRNFGNLFGATQVQNGDYFTTLKDNSYIWSYACGGGTYTTAQGIGSTSSFKTDKIESIFTMLYGSYFGDWDNQNNFLRAPIASPSSTLVSIWGGRPNWFLHSMSLGEPIGYSYISSVNNTSTYFPKGFYSGQVHQNLQGDPTLRMYMFRAPSNLLAFPSEASQQTNLQWSHSPESGVLGYFVYKASSENDNFTLLTPEYITDNFYTDITSFDAQAVYMVKAVKLQETNTGSFYNLSPGVFSNKVQNLALPIESISFSGHSNQNRTNSLFWTVENETNVQSYILERSADGVTFERMVEVSGAGETGIVEYQRLDEAPLELNYYRLKVIDMNGQFAYTEIIRIENPIQHANLEVFPSPFTEHITIRYNADLAGGLEITLRDMYGRAIKKIVHEHQGGEQTIPIAGLSYLPTGIYFVHLSDPANRTEETIKLLKQ